MTGMGGAGSLIYCGNTSEQVLGKPPKAVCLKLGSALLESMFRRDELRHSSLVCEAVPGARSAEAETLATRIRRLGTRTQELANRHLRFR